jgi:hypothetical protein
MLILLVAGFSPQSPGFASGIVNMRFVVGEVTLRKVFPRALLLYLLLLHQRLVLSAHLRSRCQCSVSHFPYNLTDLLLRNIKLIQLQDCTVMANIIRIKIVE